MGTVTGEMSSWTALTWHTGIKTEFETKNMKSFWNLNYQDFKIKE